MVVQPEMYFLKWRLPPSWIRKTAAISLVFNRLTIVTEISGNIGTSIWNILMTFSISNLKISVYIGEKHICSFLYSCYAGLYTPSVKLFLFFYIFI